MGACTLRLHVIPLADLYAPLEVQALMFSVSAVQLPPSWVWRIQELPASWLELLCVQLGVTVV